MRSLIHKAFVSYVKTLKIDAAFKLAILKHDRVNVYVDNLLKRIKAIQEKKELSKEQIISIVESLTSFFVDSVSREAKLRAESHFKKIERKKKLDDQKEIELAHKGIITGDFLEAGLQIGSSQPPAPK